MKKLTIMFALVVGTGTGLTIGCGSKSGGGGIGVKPCDDYISKLESCAGKVGGREADSMRSMAKMMKESWKKDAKNPELAKTCESASEDLAAQLPDACK